MPKRLLKLRWAIQRLRLNTLTATLNGCRKSGKNRLSNCAISKNTWKRPFLVILHRVDDSQSSFYWKWNALPTVLHHLLSSERSIGFCYSALIGWLRLVLNWVILCRWLFWRDCVSECLTGSLRTRKPDGWPTMTNRNGLRGQLWLRRLLITRLCLRQHCRTMAILLLGTFLLILILEKK